MPTRRFCFQNFTRQTLTWQALVIDEISMLEGALFDKLEALARNIKNSPKPFGGIQL